MKKLFILLIFFFYDFAFCKVINIKDFGAIGDGIFDNSNIFNSVLKNIKNNETYKIIIPEGTFLISNTIELPENVSIEGLDPTISIIKINTKNTAFTILKNKEVNFYQYKFIRNLSIRGPEYGINPFSWKDTRIVADKSVGIKVLGYRNRIENCEIDGFSNAGIQLTSSYYNFINKCFIKNNKYGIQINEISTSTYISGSEFRFNSIALLIKNSYSVYITDNIIEANFSNFIDDHNPDNSLSNGKAIVFLNSNNNYVERNFFEEQYYNVVLDQSNNNIFTSNFFAVSGKMPENIRKKNQVTFVFKNNSSYNTIRDNTIETTSQDVQKAEIIFDNSDFSTNSINFNNDINSRLKKSWQNDSKKPLLKN